MRSAASRSSGMRAPPGPSVRPGPQHAEAAAPGARQPAGRSSPSTSTLSRERSGRGRSPSAASSRTRHRLSLRAASSTSTGTVRAIWPDTAASSARSRLPVDSYRYWEARARSGRFRPRTVRENFTVEGWADDEVCIGDPYRIGTAVFEVTQPRVTVTASASAWTTPDPGAARLARPSGLRPPWCSTRERSRRATRSSRSPLGPEQMTVAEVDALLYLPGHPREGNSSGAPDSRAQPGWQASFAALVGGGSASGNAGLERTSPCSGLARVPSAHGSRDRA